MPHGDYSLIIKQKKNFDYQFYNILNVTHRPRILTCFFDFKFSCLLKNKKVLEKYIRKSARQQIVP